MNAPIVMLVCRIERVENTLQTTKSEIAELRAHIAELRRILEQTCPTTFLGRAAHLPFESEEME